MIKKSEFKWNDFLAAEIPHNGNRARFFTIILWFAATYVLSDLYSAQLTSQFARPAKEQPINTLNRLESALKNDRNYKLYVVRETASYEALKVQLILFLYFSFVGSFSYFRNFLS